MGPNKFKPGLISSNGNSVSTKVLTKATCIPSGQTWCEDPTAAT